MKSKQRLSLELTLEGENVSPETVDVVDLLRLVESYRKALVATARHLGRELNPSETLISLVGIRQKCAELKLSAAKAAKRPIQELSRAVAFNDWGRCGLVSRDCLREAAKKLAERDWTFQLPNYRTRTVILSREFVATATTKQLVSGDTMLFGKVQTAGGKQPHLELVLENGQSVRVNGSLDKIKSLGQRLYDEVGLRGTAHWDAATGQVESFDLHEVDEFESTDLVSAFAELAAVAGHNWNQVDAADFVKRQRN